MSASFHTAASLAMPAIAHGFFGREGGVSEGIFESLNCGPGSNDDAQAVEKNRTLATLAIGGQPENLCTLYQIHSPTVLNIAAPLGTNRPQADAMVTHRKGIVLGILTADCAPVLFADAKAGVVAAAHAGWKGAFNGVLENTLHSMQQLGASLENISAAIGPCIAQASYEVGEEFRARLLEAEAANQQFFIPGARAAHYQFDLPGYVQRRLQAAGLRNIESLAMDTCKLESQFFSYRRATLRGEKDYGRQLSAIMLKE